MAGPSPPPPQTSFAGLNGTRCRLRAREPRAACVARAGPASCSRKSPRLGSKSHRGKGAASRGPAVAKARAAEPPSGGTCCCWQCVCLWAPVGHSSADGHSAPSTFKFDSPVQGHAWWGLNPEDHILQPL